MLNEAKFQERRSRSSQKPSRQQCSAEAAAGLGKTTAGWPANQGHGSGRAGDLLESLQALQEGEGAGQRVIPELADQRSRQPGCVGGFPSC